MGFLFVSFNLLQQNTKDKDAIFSNLNPKNHKSKIHAEKIRIPMVLEESKVEYST